MFSDDEIGQNSSEEEILTLENEKKKEPDNIKHVDKDEEEQISPITKKILFNQSNEIINDELNNQLLPLEGTLVFVDVRAENENRSKAISKEVEKLGGIIVPKINLATTHVVFKNGRNSTITQIKKYQHIHIVSVLWVDACKTTGSRVEENDFVVDLSACSKENIIPTARAKRVKSLQPKTLEEDVNNSAKKAERRRKLLRSKGKSTGDTPPDQIICMDNSLEYIKSSDFHKLVATPRVIPDTPWILRYINTPDQKDQGSSFNDPFNESLDTGNDNRLPFKNSIRAREHENDSPLLRKSLHPTRLSTEFSDAASPNFISPTQRFCIEKKVSSNLECEFDGELSIESNNSFCKSSTSATKLEKDEAPFNSLCDDTTSFHETIPDENLDSMKTKELLIIVDKPLVPIDGMAEPVAKSNDDMEDKLESINSFKNNVRVKKKKVLFTQTAPFADSPLGDGLDHLPQDVGSFRMMNIKGKFDQYSMLQNVNTSRIVAKTKVPEDQSNQNITQESLVSKMNELNVKKDAKKGHKEKKGKSTLKSRRSSGIDFRTEKIRKDVKSATKSSINRLTDTVESETKKTINKKLHQPLFSEDSNSDTESVASNCSFIHDEDQGLIVCSQEEYRKTKLNLEDLPDLKQNSTPKTLCSNILSTQKTNTNFNLVNKPKRKSLKSNKHNDCKQLKPLTKKNSSLVSTSLHFSEQTFLKHVLKDLSGFKFRTNVTHDTTHVIAGSGRRTLNILHALVHGCWILSPKWISDSAENGKWLKETKYEMTEEFPMAKTSRISSQNGHSILKNLFSSSLPVYIADGTTPPSDELVKLVSSCGGQITNSIRKAGISVGCINSQRYKNLCAVTEKWILDSIWEGTVLPTKSYELCSDENFRVKSPDF